MQGPRDEVGRLPGARRGRGRGVGPGGRPSAGRRGGRRRRREMARRGSGRGRAGRYGRGRRWVGQVTGSGVAEEKARKWGLVGVGGASSEWGWGVGGCGEPAGRRAPRCWRSHLG